MSAATPDASTGGTWKVLVVDDEPAVLELTELVLQSLRYEGRALQFLAASSEGQAREIARQHPDLAVVLLDVVMETDHAGLEFVRYLREELGNRQARIVLRTGQPGFAPEHQVIARYDINDYREKTELTSRKLNSVMVMALRAYRDLLAAAQAERALAEAEIARRAAEDADRAKSMLLANVSHEIRTPLNAILGMTYLVLRTPLSEVQQDYLRKSHAAGVSLRRIVDDLLDASRIEANRIELVLRPFATRDLLDHVRALTAQRARDKGLSYELAASDDVPPHLIGDPERIGQILINLLSNAVKFTERGGVSLAVSAAPVDAQRVELTFVVSDSGVGIAAEDLERLFLPFSQIDATASRRHGGTGLGLSICRRLAERMGGTVDVESRRGTGSRFTFRLGLAIADADAGTVGAAPARPSSDRFTLPAGLRPVLIAADDALNRQIVAELLHEAGIPSEAVENGRAAAERLERRGARAYSALLLDIHMPELDGSDLARRLRADERYLDLPLLAMTAAASGAERTGFLDSGMDDVIVKPVDPQELIATVSRWIGSVSRAAPADRGAIHEKAAPGARDPDADDLASYVALRHLLARYDGEAGSHLERVRDRIEAMLGAACAQRLSERIAVYDFEAALMLLPEQPPAR
jgi:signal transduction histidine kinase